MLLYLDNIRGFSNQVIDLNDVNFLVGENSTGKSTVLSILHFFSEPSYESFTDFKSKFVDFGPYNEIISDSRSGKSYFQIGFYSHGKGSLSSFSGHFLLRYIETDGFPLVDRIIWLDKNTLIKLEKVEDIVTIGYVENVSPILNNNDFLFLDQIKIPLKNQIKIDVTDFVISGNELSLDSFTDLYLSEIFVKLPAAIKQKCRYFFNLGIKTLIPETLWIDPIRSKPQRVYEPQKLTYSSEGVHIPSLLKELLIDSNTSRTKKIIQKIEFFGRHTGMFEKIIIDQYRKTKHAPFSINVKLKGKTHKITNVGYGVSQILPILTEVIRREEGIFLIQQPEVHLHPKSQAFFGEFIFNEFLEGKKRFLIETHSDFIIDRFRAELRRKQNKKLIQKTNILFFERLNGLNKVTKIDLDDNADYSENQPKAFREFFLKEQMLNLGME
ncbi:MAG: AAA family ATPase [Dinghuibacter sp.]|nr:AAA family ATPase [Dinghuibacter sp.]